MIKLKKTKIAFIMAIVCIALVFSSCSLGTKDNQNKEKNIKENTNYANAVMTISIYRQAYFSIDKVIELCKGRKIDTYLRLAEETYSILNYKEIESNLPPEVLEKIQTVASNSFSNEYGSFEDKAFICAFIEATPYDIIIDTGIKLMDYSDEYADKTQYKNDYNKFKKTIFSYVPKMMANPERKKEIMKYLERFK